ncbi:MAG: hypothetical protein AAF609_23585 [Cyanobacteria bacterium P01_C01_bin.120]
MANSRVKAILTMGLGFACAAWPAQAQSPGLYYAWRLINSDSVACLERATAVLTNQELNNIQVEGNSVAGTTEDSTAVFVCLENAGNTTVMIMVSSTDDDMAFALRETLKENF